MSDACRFCPAWDAIRGRAARRSVLEGNWDIFVSILEIGVLVLRTRVEQHFCTVDDNLPCKAWRKFPRGYSLLEPHLKIV